MTGSSHAPSAGRPARSPLTSPGRWGALAALLILVFALLSWQLAAEGPLRRLDERLSSDLRQPVPVDDGPAELGADLGNFEVAVPVLALAMAYAFWRGRRAAPLVGCGLALLAVPLLVAPLKVLFDRPGPLGGSGYYPSGHTATAVVAYGAAVALLWPYLRGRAMRVLALTVATALITATGTGLVVRGYHWPLDVLASCALGGPLVLAAWHWPSRPRSARGHRPSIRPRSAHHRRDEPPPHASPTQGSPDR